jgi:hypothetical protein
MKNCIVLGAGRSGTSMVAGTLADAGYYMGDTMMSATDANPKGYFESREVETVNDGLVATMLQPSRRERLLTLGRGIPRQPNFEDATPGMRVHWLALIPTLRRPYPRASLVRQIETLTQRRPFCFKDPRFSYTLPVWRPYLTDTVYVCVFREPTVTAVSTLKEVEREPYLAGIRYSFDMALDLWVYTYRHILEKHRHQGDWLFLHYDQVLTPDGLDRLEAHTGARVNRDFPDAALKRSESREAIPPRAARVYESLCALAGVRDA